ncbi:MAG: type II toxin-antitoxin system Phd/YefM family antitoxin [Alcanivoracaceae bacterium]|nr:type II toxin-antitoxin system Phd/YefM family antitoxin [Alcanivoracaceae bacterium]
MRNTWQLQEVKSKFSQLVERALSDEPQFVTKHGKNAVVILSFDDFKNITKLTTDLVSFFKNSPLAEIEFDISRSKDIPRELDL